MTDFDGSSESAELRDPTSGASLAWDGKPFDLSPLQPRVIGAGHIQAYCVQLANFPVDEFLFRGDVGGSDQDRHVDLAMTGLSAGMHVIARIRVSGGDGGAFHTSIYGASKEKEITQVQAAGGPGQREIVFIIYNVDTALETPLIRLRNIGKGQEWRFHGATIALLP